MSELKPPSPSGRTSPEGPDSTTQLPTGAPLEDGTVRLGVAPSFGAVEPPSGAAASPKGGGKALWIGVAVVLILGLCGGLAYALAGRKAPAPPVQASAAPENLPAGVKVYLDKANAGDHQAMYMLGTMYYYGLYIPQDREKGLHWYREAAAHGSQAAKDDLAKLQAAGNTP